MPKTNTSKKILDLIAKQSTASPKDIANLIGISNVAVHKQLRKLEADGKIEKIGTPPLVYYSLVSFEENVIPGTQTPKLNTNLNSELYEQIEKNFIYSRPNGTILYGMLAFDEWIKKQQNKGQVLDKVKTASQYADIVAKYNRFKNSQSLIEATSKLQTTFKEVYLDRLYFIDFYSYERFGKTKLAELTFLAKQTENRKLIGEVVDIVEIKILNLIINHKIDSIAFVPPTARRITQFMQELEKGLSIPLPVCKIQKLNTPVRIQQKSIRDLDDRVINADKTMVVSEKRQFNTTLLVDDFVGSGSTMNIIAKKLKQVDVSKSVIGIAITGSLKGFEVINQV
ncbi:MAG: winged helix-turn-helix transcriptional regulator [Patescibacteria group bacterium]